MAKVSIRLTTDRARGRAKRLIDQAPDGFIMKLAEETRSDEQNRKMWPMIQEIQRQVPEMTPYSAEDIKLRFLNALGTEMRFLPMLEGQGVFPVGHRSSVLTKDQFSALIELLYEYGARHGVQWSNPE